ncbi:hypothetical protein SEA_NANOSMITE_160 [Mycobacterium phage Nanosmite]|nr:hypothetical protein SEA_NANOSMITE_160 [Mycobacterium phage Nanosmite]
MATDRKITKYEVQPLENADGTLEGLKIQRTERIQRESDNGRVLDYGYPVRDVGEPLEIPASKISDLVRELVDWPLYYATGQAAREG